VQHLDACDVCRAEVVETSRLLAEDVDPRGACAGGAGRTQALAGPGDGGSRDGRRAGGHPAGPARWDPAGQEAVDRERFVTEGVDRLDGLRSAGRRHRPAG
jgi:hypothetical protein